MFSTNRKAKSTGFTLIELLVVIAIIGVLASVVLASLNTARRKSRDARRIADVKQIQLALELYFDACLNYSQNIYNASATCGTSGIAPTYIPVVPKDPLSVAGACGGAGVICYNFASLGSGTSCTSYHLGATLEDAGNPALNADADAASTGTCTGGGTDFAGTDPLYDVKP